MKQSKSSTAQILFQVNQISNQN